MAERRITAILSTLARTDLPHLYTATTSEGGECRWATYRRGGRKRRSEVYTAEADLYSHPPPCAVPLCTVPSLLDNSCHTTVALP